jgi:hypothetical protein
MLQQQQQQHRLLAEGCTETSAPASMCAQGNGALQLPRTVVQIGLARLAVVALLKADMSCLGGFIMAVIHVSLDWVRWQSGLRLGCSVNSALCRVGADGAAYYD